MAIQKVDEDSALGYGLIGSTAIHLAVFLLLVWWGKLFPTVMTIKETYYVDVVTMPVADPRAGSPTQKGDEPQVTPPPPSQAQMTVPQQTSKTAQRAANKIAPQKAAPSDDDFAKRMAKLEKNVEARHEESVLEGLRTKVKSNGSGRAGMPGASGKERGSDYSAYIQSRLKDAFRETISYTTKNPEMIVKLYIDTNGKLTRRTPEKSSGDRAFELSVQRAIDMASEKFPPPPAKQPFEGVFVFKPQGIISAPGK
ncbi:MAG: TonB family protein [Desulfuromonadales bacterium]